MLQLQEVNDNPKSITTPLAAIKGNGTPCNLTECVYCLNSNYCGHLRLPRNQDGYCKDFISVND